MPAAQPPQTPDPGTGASRPDGSLVGLGRRCVSQSHVGHRACSLWEPVRYQSITVGMGAPSSVLPLRKTPGLSCWWAVIQQSQLGWGPACPCLAAGTLLSPTRSCPWRGRLTWLPRGKGAAPQRARRGAGARGGSCECPGRGGRSGRRAGAGAAPGAAAGPGGPVGLWLAGHTPPGPESLQWRGNRRRKINLGCRGIPLPLMEARCLPSHMA